MSGSPGATRHSTALIPLVLEFHCFDILGAAFSRPNSAASPVPAVMRVAVSRRKMRPPHAVAQSREHSRTSGGDTLRNCWLANIGCRRALVGVQSRDVALFIRTQSPASGTGRPGSACQCFCGTLRRSVVTAIDNAQLTLPHIRHLNVHRVRQTQHK
jgi:hypothetical protein